MGGQRYDKRNYERNEHPDFGVWFISEPHWYSGCRPDSLWLKPDLQELRMPEILS